ncbi:hypothetical protein KGM_201253 [Danaus plexippus plexippus]|uniref:THAP-type domain-containing protein n=1 Tax=Danaus plexippus plexippus TaxID=278856 RepID=A0A212F9Y3_DANPL|nr:hypothetical protein KGM_201253 [Danaus plexippus plexippus]
MNFKDGTEFVYYDENIFRFPRDKDLCQKWVDAVRLERHDPWWNSTKASRICSIHFKKSDMMSTPCKVNVLTKSAVPICTMVWYDRDSNVSSNLSLPTENINIYDNITKAHELKESNPKVLEESSTNVSDDNGLACQESDKVFDILKETKKQHLNGSPETELANESTSQQGSKDQEEAIDIAEFIKFNTKDTCIKLNDNTSIILKEDVNEKSINTCQMPNSSKCLTKPLEVNNFKLLENKESKDDRSDEPKIDLCSGEIQQIDLKSTFIGKILKTYLPKRKFKKSRQKFITEVCKDNDENKSIDIKSVNDDLPNNLFNETEIKIPDRPINDTESSNEIIDKNNAVFFEKCLENDDNVGDGKESRKTDFNDIHLDIVGKQQLILDKQSINDICNESIENMCVQTSREFQIGSNLSANSNMIKDSNTHLILELDTQLYTETDVVGNIIDSFKESCELTNEQNNQPNDVTEIALITELIDTNESIPMSDEVNTSSHRNELSLINIFDPIQPTNDLISETQYEILTDFDNNAPESQQSNDIFNNAKFPTKNDLFNTETSENIDIGLENLQCEVKLNSTLNEFDPKKGEQYVSFVSIESSLNNSNLDTIRQLGASEIDKEGISFLSKDVRINVNGYEEGDLEHQIILQKDVLTSREDERNKVIVNNLIWEGNQEDLILSANLKCDNYSHCENNYAIQSNDRSDRQLSELCNVDNNKTHNETYFPELLKHLTAKPKMDSLVELCTNSLTEVDKKIFSKYGNMALVNKKRLQDIYGYNREEIYKNLDIDNGMSTISENNINISEGEQFNAVSDQLESNLDDSMELINGLDPSIAEQILSEETITSSTNFIETVGRQLKDKDENITTSELGELIQNEMLTIPEDTIVKINENISEGLTNKDLGKLCGKFGLDFENASPISGIAEENIEDEDIQVIESNLDIDKENTSEFDFSLLLENSLPDTEAENPDDDFDCNEKNSPADLMDLATVDIPESIDGILDEEGSLFENLDLLESSSLDSNEELKMKRNELNVTKNNEEPLSVPHCDELRECLSIANICEMEKEQSKTCVSHFDSKAKQLVERLIESSANLNLSTEEQSKEQFAGKCCVSLKELYNETLEQYRLNLENIKKHILDECCDKQIKNNISTSNGQHFKSFRLNEDVSSNVPSDLRDIGFENDINLLQKINNSSIHGAHELQGQKNDEIIDELVDLSDILFKDNVTPFSMDLENQDRELKSIRSNNSDPIELNVINNQKNPYALEQEKELFNDRDVDMSNIDEILDEICSEQCLEAENESLDQIKEPKSNNNNMTNMKLNLRENSNRILKDLYNKSVEMSRSLKKDKHNASVGYDSAKISSVTGRRLSVEQLKREIFDQCFSSECGNSCKKGHHNTTKNKISRFKTQDIEIANNFDIKKRSKKKQKHRKQPSTKKQKNKSTCLSPCKEKIKLKYKEFSIDLLKGQCFEFSQKGIEDEANINEKKIKRKCNDPTLESRKIQCTESLIEENKCGQSIELTLKKNDSTDTNIQDSNCNTLKELEAECPNCGFVTNDDDVDLSIKEPLTVINKGMLLNNMEKKSNGNDGNKNVPLRSTKEDE